ncbi:MAG TPA: pilus assembly protein TadG-related protein [Acidimicrobiales bacterium]|jgi:Flp pilus assembly protein TadG|nr:pilus assembly protein TadG-related protein [Acidimicrobiales bacterium]
MTHHRRGDERGAVLILMVAFSLVMVGMAALVVDVGAIHDEKRQLQNGADSAALGLAQHIGANCATAPNPTSCSATTLQSTADVLAVGNARDSAVKVDVPTVDYANNRVTVRTSTRASNGGTILPYQFGKALTGVEGKTVRATAVASWSGLKRASVIPLTISKCEFTTATQNGTVFGTPQTILFHSKAQPCGGGPDLPGGFGWLADNNDTNSGDCNVTPATGNIVSVDTGVVGTPHSCNMSTLLGKDVLLSVYDSFTGSGTNGRYRIYGFGQFHLTGYRFTSTNSGGTVPCSSPNTCIAGYFIRFVPVGELGGPSLGNRVALVS